MSRRQSQLGEQWVSHQREMRESPAWAALGDNGRRVLDRLELEHMQHGGAENGNLTCTYSDFERVGLDRRAIKPAIDQCVALGFLKVRQHGYKTIKSFRAPNCYLLTYLVPRKDKRDSLAPTHDWKAIKTAEDARLACACIRKPLNVKAEPSMMPSDVAIH